MPTVWLIRHAQSESNANLKTTHPARSALTELGQWEASRLVTAFRQKPDLLVVSSFLRAQQTAVPLIAHFDPIAVEEWPVYEFTYLAPERYANTTADERAPFAREYWLRNDPLYKDGGEGESFAELLARVWELVARLQQHPGQFLALIGHGLFWRALLWAVLTNTHAATPQALHHYSHFVQSVFMPNTAVCRTHFSPTAVYFSPFDITHLSTGGET